MDCKHLECEIIYTRESEIIIDTNYQCRECGKIISEEKYQEILTYNCSWCNGSGECEIQGDKYNCGCIIK